ncbi:MAG TPA: GNAT family N-acetyltransferase [Candidatus Aphodoplasma excrementigallinarum]|uniref:Aminoglycoside N(6')-acetyltransferase type 1 n=1 Tax=Candidatus Aphodoplasma excrementigallinarum TaxID=2840673 RepID=A0A9D1NIH7_9FIRM|nr:GNAT family N-acetyltransferase [Candidatus Aphodoplasma excrementigallinarum]
MTIVRAGREQAAAVVRLALMLWPDNAETELKEELAPLLESADAAFFLAQEQGGWVGFAQCQLRRDYVEGTSSSPVGYLEGIYVIEPCRRRGIAAAPLEECQLWAKGQGRREFASDCELGNDESLRFHESVGFREANRIICFTKRI